MRTSDGKRVYPGKVLTLGAECFIISIIKAVHFMVKIIVLEDEDRQAEQTMGFLRRYEQENGQPIYVKRYSRAIDLVEHYHCDADILLLDLSLIHI